MIEIKCEDQESYDGVYAALAKCPLIGDCDIDHDEENESWTIDGECHDEDPRLRAFIEELEATYSITISGNEAWDEEEDE